MKPKAIHDTGTATVIDFDNGTSKVYPGVHFFVPSSLLLHEPNKVDCFVFCLGKKSVVWRLDHKGALNELLNLYLDSYGEIPTYFWMTPNEFGLVRVK